MKKNIDVAVAYLGIFLLLLTPVYYSLNIILDMTNILFNEVVLLFLAAVIDLIFVLKRFRIYYR
ncbi:hypothetical protein EFM09_01075 [Latilactobacillus curvatus]|nr:hypothetical protein [Latilactobacillus curvatus]UTC14141.1 hypothetical protein A4W80_04050 [Latilactobacillus curvatus]